MSAHIEHARGFLAGLGTDRTRIVDLGSGGGVPGLVLALELPQTSWTLLDSNHRRARFLVEAVGRLGLEARVAVYEGRVERAGRDDAQRGSYDAAVARSFGPPPVTAEAAAPLLRVGGVLVVSEPPAPMPGRWPAHGLAKLGMAAGEPYEEGGSHYRVVRQVEPCPDRFPRREGVATKRPVFDVSRETLN